MAKKNNAPNPSYEELGYYFIRVGGFFVQNGILMDNESRQPIMYPSYKGPQYIAYPPQANTSPNVNVISLDVMRNTKVIEFLFNFWCSKQPYTNEKYIKYSNLYSMTRWKSNLSNFKSTLTTRYNRVVGNLKSYFNLSNSEYNKYFGDLK